jgi:hypothetical protein
MEKFHKIRNNIWLSVDNVLHKGSPKPCSLHRPTHPVIYVNALLITMHVTQMLSTTTHSVVRTKESTNRNSYTVVYFLQELVFT